MSTYTMSPLTASDISQIDLGPYSIGEKKLPNKKISIDVHTAHGGYVVRVCKGHGTEDDMYVISDHQELGQELGKILTHTFLKTEHE